MAWSLTGGTFTELNVVECSRSLQAGGMDSCTVVFAKSSSDALAYAEDDAVTVVGPTGNFFVGRVVRPIRTATGNSEHHVLELGTPWSILEEIPYLQDYASGEANTPTKKSRVLLGLDDFGSRQNTAQIISDIITYANSQGAGISTGAILPGMLLTPPVMEMTDVTCAEAIRSVLRWHPDCIVTWDHAGGGALNIVKAGSLSAVSRVAGPDADYNGVTATVYPRGDMVLRGVSIHYEATGTVDGTPYKEIVIDSAGATEGRRVAHLTIDLQGADITNQSQEIETLDIPDGLPPNDPDLLAWVRSHFTRIDAANPTAGQILILGPIQKVHEDEEVGPGTTPDEYPRELIGGQIRPWMAGVSAAPVDLSIKVKCMVGPGENEDLYKLFPRSEKIEIFTVKVMGTDAMTRTYKRQTGTPGEDVPEGLALAYYQAFQSVVPEGEFTSVGIEPDLEVVPGAALTLSGALTVTAAPVQSCATDAMTGRTQARFGPMNASISPVDFLEIQRAGNRTRPLVNPAASARTDSSTPENQTSQGATGGRIISETYTTGTPADAFFHASNGGENIVNTAAGVVVSTKWPSTISDSAPVVTTPAGRIGVTATSHTAEPGKKIWLKINYTKKDYEPELETDTGGVLKLKNTAYEATSTDWVIVTGTPTDTETASHVLIVEVEEGDDGEIIIKQKHEGIVTVTGACVSILSDSEGDVGVGRRALQTVVRQVGSDWNIGITSGVVMGMAWEDPITKPDNVLLSSASVVWFDGDFTGSDPAESRNVWLYLGLEDSDYYQGDITTAEIWLKELDDDPSPIFTAEESQWFLIGTVNSGDGTLRPVSHVSGSLRTARLGGPGSGYRIYCA